IQQCAQKRFDLFHAQQAVFRKENRTENRTEATLTRMGFGYFECFALSGQQRAEWFCQNCRTRSSLGRSHSGSRPGQVCGEVGSEKVRCLMEDVVGTLAGILTSVAMLPQLVKVLTEKK